MQRRVVIVELARWLLPIVAIACWRRSRIVSVALGLAFLVALIYVHVWRWEGLRWVSAATGFLGVVELGRRAVMRGARPADLESAARILVDGGLFLTMAEARADIRRSWDRRWRAGRADVLSAILVGSMASDGLALLGHRARGLWGPLPVLQVFVLVLMLLISLWPERAGRNRCPT